MTNIIVTAVLFLVNSVVAFVMTIHAHALWSNGQSALGFIVVSLAVLNAYCALDGIERLAERIKEYNNG